MSEIYSRGPVAATINAEPIVKYTGGVFSEEGKSWTACALANFIVVSIRLLTLLRKLNLFACRPFGANKPYRRHRRVGNR